MPPTSFSLSIPLEKFLETRALGSVLAMLLENAPSRGKGKGTSAAAGEEGVSGNAGASPPMTPAKHKRRAGPNGAGSDADAGGGAAEEAAPPASAAAAKRARTVSGAGAARTRPGARAPACGAAGGAPMGRLR
jgi:hypothetical protein